MKLFTIRPGESAGPLAMPLQYSTILQSNAPAVVQISLKTSHLSSALIAHKIVQRASMIPPEIGLHAPHVEVALLS
jgi:hypothetical protein